MRCKIRIFCLAVIVIVISAASAWCQDFFKGKGDPDSRGLPDGRRRRRRGTAAWKISRAPSARQSGGHCAQHAGRRGIDCCQLVRAVRQTGRLAASLRQLDEYR